MPDDTALARRAREDGVLVERARLGDLQAYEELVVRHQVEAHRVAWLVAGAAVADDVTQAAFFKAWHALDRFRAGSPFRPWLLRIVANEARNDRRAQGRRAALALRSVTTAPTAGTAPSAEEAALGHAQRAELLAAVGALTERDRLVVFYRYFLGLSEAEMAVALDCPRGTVKSRLSRALDRLRASLAAPVEPTVGGGDR